MPAEIFGPDLLIVAVIVVALLLLGPKLPKLARSLGSARHQFEEGMKEGKAESASSNGTSAATDTPAETRTPPAEGTSQAS